MSETHEAFSFLEVHHGRLCDVSFLCVLLFYRLRHPDRKRIEPTSPPGRKIFDNGEKYEDTYKISHSKDQN